MKLSPVSLSPPVMRRFVRLSASSALFFCVLAAAPNGWSQPVDEPWETADGLPSPASIRDRVMSRLVAFPPSPPIFGGALSGAVGFFGINGEKVLAPEELADVADESFY